MITSRDRNKSLQLEIQKMMRRCWRAWLQRQSPIFARRRFMLQDSGGLNLEGIDEKVQLKATATDPGLCTSCPGKRCAQLVKYDNCGAIAVRVSGS